LNENQAENDIERDSYLKLTLNCVHNSIEVLTLTKELLSRIIELIIYKDLSNFLEVLETSY